MPGGKKNEPESFMPVAGAIYRTMAGKDASNSRIGVVVHGPEIIDSGRALQLINYLKGFGRLTAVLGGTMDRLALCGEVVCARASPVISRTFTTKSTKRTKNSQRRHFRATLEAHRGLAEKKVSITHGK